MEDILTKIQSLKAQQDSIERARRYRQELERNRKALQSKADQLGRTMDKEHQDLLDLEKWSVKELFIKVINKQEQLEKEKEEYLQAAIAFQDAKKELEMLDFEINVLREKEKGAETIKKQIRELYELREADILQHQPDHPLKPVLSDLARWNQIDRELEEAILHGANAQSLLEEISQNLHRANSWVNNNMREVDYRLRMIAEEVDEARLRLPKLRLEFMKFDQEIKEVYQFPEVRNLEQQNPGLEQVQQLAQELSGFIRQITRGFSYHRGLPIQLHQIHTLSNHLRNQMETSVKWLRLEQQRTQRESLRLEEQKRELLG
ncbi:hypothetical protein [Flavilitoribacter nigricans]|uniref:Uncharacterized protein n=1 Tax=Flavilitoribacter nigricans (strain ATCC 23147 / DSM 23189 / NBRC 102662 / NCIMB 1420 / SS-2) TaxID=1122177 RepID=A0A2D0NI56_FLAN2|nr:hypothetical protein [Flavilitoribacter nigricans]PHN07443.1 hypothetical protein CRP01_07395 [Flavilitoribacter nigricans DSM 23189 = NBRC 102662]